MVDKLTKYCKILLITLMVLNVVFAILGVYNGKDSVGIFMVFAYCMLGILAVVAILFAPIYGIAINPKSLKKIGLYFLIAVVVGLIAWLISKASVLGKPLGSEYLETMEVTSGTEKLVDFFMVFTYFIIGATIVTVIFSAISKLLKK